MSYKFTDENLDLDNSDFNVYEMYARNLERALMKHDSPSSEFRYLHDKTLKIIMGIENFLTLHEHRDETNTNPTTKSNRTTFNEIKHRAELVLELWIKIFSATRMEVPELRLMADRLHLLHKKLLEIGYNEYPILLAEAHIRTIGPTLDDLTEAIDETKESLSSFKGHAHEILTEITSNPGKPLSIIKKFLLHKAPNDFGYIVPEISGKVQQRLMSILNDRQIQSIKGKHNPPTGTSAEQNLSNTPPATVIASETASLGLREWTFEFRTQSTNIQNISYCLWSFSEALATVDGVHLSLSDWGRGSFWAKLKVKIFGETSKEEVLQLLDKIVKRITAEHLHQPILDAEGTRLDNVKKEEEIKRLCDPEKLREAEDLNLQEARARIKNLELDKKLKEADLLIKKMQAHELASEMAAKGFIKMDSDYQLSIENLLLIKKEEVGGIHIGDISTLKKEPDGDL